MQLEIYACVNVHFSQSTKLNLLKHATVCKTVLHTPGPKARGPSLQVQPGCKGKHRPVESGGRPHQPVRKRSHATGTALPTQGLRHPRLLSPA